MVNENPIPQPAEERFRAVLEQSPYSIQIMSPDGRTLRVNRAWEELWGVKLEQIAGYNMLEDRQLVERGIMPLIRRAFGGEAVELPLILYDPEETVPGATRHRDARRWTKAVAYPIKDAAGRVLEVVLMHEDVTARVLAEEEHARLAAEVEARRQRREADDHFLAEATTALASSLDYETTLSTLARLAVPSFADWCGVDIADEGGTLRRLAVAHVDPAKVAWALELQQRYPPDPAAPRGSYQVLRTGESEFYPEITDEMLVAAAHDEEHLAALRAMEFRSAMVVPLKTRDRVLGIIVFVNTESGRRHAPEDLAFAEDLAGRAALAVENARLYRAEQQTRKAAEQTFDRLARLQAISSALSQALTPQQVAAAVIEQGISSLGAHAGSVVALDDDGMNLDLVTTVGFPPEVVEGWQRFALETPVPLADAARERLPVLIESFANYSERYPMLGPLASVTGSRALVALPLIVKGRTIGAIGLSFPKAQSFTEDDRAFMLALAQQCAQALERARLYETEQRLRAEAEAANRLKDEFLATVSHELRTPLTAIVGWSSMLRANVLDEESKARAVETIERNAKAQAQIVEDLLDVSRIITGKLALDARAVELTSVVEAALESVRPAAAKKGLVVKSEVEPGVGAVWGDPARLEQVMWNLLS
ncbi:MAG TPA: GAF domain-containing protein, partial [Pyrinomonadaceae bacterium]|nr:GAF domain-containing protein [Pyrinomonadaceae bacterium]